MPTSTRSLVPKPSSAGRNRRGEFYRPELTTPWQKFTQNLAVRISAGVVLVGGTGALIWAAVSAM